MAILFLGSQMAVGGAQQVLLSQASWFHARGHRVVAAFFYDKEGLRDRWQSSHTFPLLDLDAWQWQGNPLANALRLFRGLFRLLRLLFSERFEVVETFTPHSNLLGLPLAWLARVPLRVATHHGFIQDSSPTLAWAHGRLINLGLATHLVAVSKRVRDLAIEHEGVRPDRVSVIKNGITPPDPDIHSSVERDRLRRELGVSNESVLLLSVGRLTLEKGHTFLLEAVPAILQTHPEAVFAFAGDGPQRLALEDQARRLDLLDRVRFLGLRSDVPALLQAADMFVLPSLSEGAPIALLEAMSLGLPVVASQVGGVAEIIQQGENGLLVPPQDAEALAAAILRLLQRPEEGLRLGEAARELIAVEYTVERMCEHYARLFRAQFQRLEA